MESKPNFLLENGGSLLMVHVLDDVAYETILETIGSIFDGELPCGTRSDIGAQVTEFALGLGHAIAIEASAMPISNHKTFAVTTTGNA